MPNELKNYKEVNDHKVYKTTVYSRVVGYLSPVSGWNKGKKEEFNDRQEYDIPEIAKVN